MATLQCDKCGYPAKPCPQQTQGNCGELKIVGAYFDERGTLRNGDGSRSVFDDVDE